MSLVVAPSAFCSQIAHIFCLSAWNEVLRINAIADIAHMIQTLIIRQMSIGKVVRQTMSKYLPAMYRQESVSVNHARAGPKPTCIRFLDTLPEVVPFSLCERFISEVNG